MGETALTISSLIDRLWGDFEPRRWFLWVPVFLALGGVAYFQMDREPPLVAILSGGGLLVFGLVFFRRNLTQRLQRSAAVWEIGLTGALFLTNAVTAFIVGFVAANVRTTVLATPPLEQSFECATYRGVVLDMEDVPRGTLNRPRLMRRLILNRVEVLAPSASPQKGKPSPIDPTASPVVHYPPHLKVRIQGPYPRLKKIRRGDRLTVQGALTPPPFPLTLHGYDAPFDLYFKRLSGFGKVAAFVANEPQTANEEPLQKIRAHLSEALRQRVDPSVAPLATALITGDRSGLTFRMREHFTRAGLSHTLAISGLHMGLVAGIVFWIFLRGLACIPPLATRFVVKKIAAILTIPIAFAYLLLSGASFSAIRAFIMVSMAMLAILIDQRPISLRCTAVAASVILIVFPESIYSVSFQLSFASVTGLCYAYESGNLAGRWSAQMARRLLGHKRVLRKPLEEIPGIFNRTVQRIVRSRFIQGILKMARRVLCLLEQSVLTTLIATVVTTPITLYVFQRMTFVGVLGNLLAVPVLSFCVIPSALLSVASLVFGGSAWAFGLWESSLRLLSNIATFVAGLPGSHIVLPRPSCSSLVVLILAALWGMIWREKKRRLAVPFLVVSLVAFALPHPPDVFIAQKGQIIGVRDDTTFWISTPRWGSFHAKVWAQECGLEEVRPMPYRMVRTWRETLKPWLPEHPGDVTFVWRPSDCSVRTQTTPFTKKRRPWYVPSAPHVSDPKTPPDGLSGTHP